MAEKNDLMEQIDKIREEHAKEWNKVEEIAKSLREMEIGRYELSGTTDRPAFISYFASIG